METQGECNISLMQTSQQILTGCSVDCEEIRAPDRSINQPGTVDRRDNTKPSTNTLTSCSKTKMKISSLLDHIPAKIPVIPKMPSTIRQPFSIHSELLRYPQRCSLPALPCASAESSLVFRSYSAPVGQQSNMWHTHHPVPLPVTALAAPPVPLAPRFPSAPSSSTIAHGTAPHVVVAALRTPGCGLAPRRTRVLPHAESTRSPPSLFGFSLQLQLAGSRRGGATAVPPPQTPAVRRCYYEARRARDGPVCRKCGKVFKSKQGVNRHNHTVHLKLRPYKCEDCAASFGQKCSLQRHQRKVHNRKHIPFDCEHARCARQFADYRLLQAHIKEAHNGEPPFRCSVPSCTAEFMWRSSHASHMKVSHGYLISGSGEEDSAMS